MTDRKERLAALAARAGRAKPPANPIDEISEPPKVLFRNYAPDDNTLVQTSEEKQSSPAMKKLKIEDALKHAEDEIKKEVSTTVDAVNATKRINWDLKRDIAPQFDKLERRTQKALMKLLKAKLAKEADLDEIID